MSDPAPHDHPPAAQQAGQAGRRLSPNAQRSGGVIALLLEQIRAELLSSARVPEFLIGVVAIPVMLYAMFGLPNAGQQLPGGINVAAILLPSFAAYGVVSLMLFSFGADTAQERGKGWLRLMRATPAPGWAYLGGKLALAVVFALLIVLVLFAVGYLFGNVRLPAGRWWALLGTLLAGGLALSPMGMAIGFLARPRAASTITNLVFLPLSFASGFFIPLSQLPEFLQRLAPYLPTYHFGRLAWGTVASPEVVGSFTGIAPGSTALHVAVLAATALAFGALALWGYARDRQSDTA